MAENASTKIIKITEGDLHNKIYTIRGQKVMLDYDLAKIYGYTTSAFNQQVKRNIERFDRDFMFQLERDEFEKVVISQNVISRIPTNAFSGQDGGTRKLPYAFTEQGIYMLMTVLRGELAISQSKILIRMFKAMKDYILEDNGLNQGYINNLVLKDHTRIDLLEDYFREYTKREKLNKIFFEGQIYDAYSLLMDILGMVKEEIIIIDNYAGKALLDILKKINVKIIIVSKNIDKTLQEKYGKQYTNINSVLLLMKWRTELN